MIKIAILLEKSPEIESAVFHDRWIQSGSDVHKWLGLAAGALRYTQNHVLPGDSPFATAMVSQFDGVEEYWFENREAAERYFQNISELERERRRQIGVDRCSAMTCTVVVMCDDNSTIDRSAKMFVGALRKDGLSRAEFFHHWIERHFPLAAANPGGLGTLQRLEYCPAEEWEIPGMQPAGFDGTSAFWIESFEKFAANLATPYYRDVLMPDEARFAKMEGSFVMLSTEHATWESAEWRGASPIHTHR